MRTITWTTLSTELQPWLDARARPANFYAQGGWESWVQNDFVAYLDQQYPDPASAVDVQRESALPYSIDARCDWLLNYNTARATPASQIVVEIKAESPQMRGSSFLAGVRADIAQLASRASFQAAFQDAMRVELVFVIRQETFEALTSPAYSMLPVAFLRDEVYVVERVVQFA